VTPSLAPRQLPAHLLKQGRYSFTLAEARELLGLTEPSAIAALSRLKKGGHLFSPAQGFYVLVPAEYQSWGVLPADWFVDAMFEYLQQPYYAAFLTAAASHGASHHAPQVFQLMTPARLKPRDIGRVRLRFYRSRHFTRAETIELTVPTGSLTVATKETTVVDLVANPRQGGGYDNVATIVREIGALDGAALARIASPRGLAVVRRVGWLVESFGEVDELEALRQAARLDQGEASPLDPGRGRSGNVEKRWSLRVNRRVEPEL
jgi:predicted transcriptional regulator of viral defense system